MFSVGCPHVVRGIVADCITIISTLFPLMEMFHD